MNRSFDKSNSYGKNKENGKTIIVSTEQRFYLSYDGTVWVCGNENYNFFSRYLMAAERVVAIGRRLTNTPDAKLSWQRADGTGVHIVLLPDFKGLHGFLYGLISHRVRNVFKCIANRSGDQTAVILRVPGAVSLFTYFYAKRYCKCFYSVELVTDPAGTFSLDALGTCWAPLLRGVAVRAVRKLCWNAQSVSYVTDDILQKRYPNQHGRHFSYSSVELQGYLLEMGKARLSQEYGNSGKFKIVFIGRLNRPFKGLDLLIEAIREVNHDKTLLLDVIGGGALMPRYKTMTQACGVEDKVFFHGELPGGQSVYDHLLKADLFVLPSRREGLPRALIEAMACGLPCIATPVGGVSELLSPGALCEVGDVESLRKKIEYFLQNPHKMKKEAEKNWSTACKFKAEIMQQKRKEFYAFQFKRQQPE